MKQKLKNLITALKIAQQIPAHAVKAKQIRSFFQEVDMLNFPEGEGIVFANSYEDGKYHFSYTNLGLRIEVEVEAFVNDTEQSVYIHKENIFPD